MADEMPPPTFRVRCPRCAAQADAIMKPMGARATYRDIYGAPCAEDWIRGTQAERIICAHCGLAKIAGATSLRFELWYRANVRGHTLWACNEEHMQSLIDVLAGERGQTGTVYEALPGWMMRNRSEVIETLRKLLNGGV